jgi:energy-coupling factor transporter ATP-binding protein EcfA2
MEKIEKPKSRWQGVPLEERLQYMTQEMHVHHPTFIRALLEIKDQVRICEQLKKGSGLLVLAPSGSGKSHLSRYLKRLWPDDHEGWKSKVPVVSFSLPSVMTKRSIAVELLRSIQPAAGVTQKDQSLESRIQTLLSHIGTRVIVIDNVHDITARRKAGGIKDIGDWIRDLIDNSKILVVLLGAPSAKEIIQRNPQLRRRATRQVKIDYFKINTAKRFVDFQEFLKRFDAELPLAQTTEVTSAMTKRIYFATNGIFDYVFMLFSRVVGFAVDAGRDQWNQEDLAKGFQTMMGDSIRSSQNPFLANGPSRPLDQVGEPYHDLYDTWDNPVRKD